MIAKPKSAILGCFPTNNIFWGLISLCIIPLECKKDNPKQIYLTNCNRSFSLRDDGWLINLWRSPSGQYSVIM